MTAQRRRALSRAAFVVALAQSAKHVGQQLESRCERQLTRGLLRLADGNHAARQPLCFVEGTLGAAHLHQAAENRRRFRVIGPLRNLDAWYDAFKIDAASKFYIPPEKRVRIW